jgi:hypothetical protein
MRNQLDSTNTSVRYGGKMSKLDAKSVETTGQETEKRTTKREKSKTTMMMRNLRNTNRDKTGRANPSPFDDTMANWKI